jgi:hypothetical protein
MEIEFLAIAVPDEMSNGSKIAKKAVMSVDQ